MSAPRAWTKKDIRTLCGMLDSWWVTNRPIDWRGHAAARDQARQLLSNPRLRTEMVLAGIRSARATSGERYRLDCETIGNQIVRFTEYGRPDELIERFTKLAREEDAANKRLETLLHRVLDEGLPPEVEAHDPTAGRP